VRLLLVVSALGLLASCASPTASAPAPARANPPLTAVITSSDLATGFNHVGMALLDDRNQPIADAAPHLLFYDLSGEQPVPVGETTPVWRRPGSEWNRGQYKTDFTFEKPGPHGVAASLSGKDGQPLIARTRFDVKARSEAPGIGAPAPRSHNLTVRDDVNPVELCTATAEMCAATADLRQLTIAEALARGKPTVVLFATPGFCTSQTCGPQLEVLQAVANRYRDRASFVHVEIFKDPQARTVNATVQEWNLPSEPWTFVIDSSGVVADRFDGITAPEEIEQALQRLLS
jgi:peroxiredoxin